MMRKFLRRNTEVGVDVPENVNKRISDALSKWSKLPLEEKINITKITNNMFPDAAEPLKEEIEIMKENKNFYGSSIGCWLTQDTEKDTELWNKAVAKILQKGDAQSLDKLQYDGKDVELDPELKKKLESFRRDRS